DGTSRKIAERAKDQIEPRLSLFNHVVEYKHTAAIVNRFVECPREPTAGAAAGRLLTEIHTVQRSGCRLFDERFNEVGHVRFHRRAVDVFPPIPGGRGPTNLLRPAV